METWKRILLRAAGFGGGFAITAAVVIGLLIWCSGRPKKPKPWNKTAVTASFEPVDTEGEQNTFSVAYTLQNNTDTDVQITDKTSVRLAALLTRSKSFSFDQSDGLLSTEYPIYIPAKSRALFHLHIKYPSDLKDDVNASQDVRHDWETKVCKYMTDQFNNLDGFAMLVDTERYEVDMPNGWIQRGKEPLRVKATGGQ